MLKHVRNLNQVGVKINLLHQLIHLKKKIAAYHLSMKHDSNVLLAEQTNIYSV